MEMRKNAMEAKKESAEKDEIINRMRLELENMRQ